MQTSVLKWRGKALSKIPSETRIGSTLSINWLALQYPLQEKRIHTHSHTHTLTHTHTHTHAHMHSHTSTPPTYSTTHTTHTHNTHTTHTHTHMHTIYRALISHQSGAASFACLSVPQRGTTYLLAELSIWSWVSISNCKAGLHTPLSSIGVMVLHVLRLTQPFNVHSTSEIITQKRTYKCHTNLSRPGLLQWSHTILRGSCCIFLFSKIWQLMTME